MDIPVRRRIRPRNRKTGPVILPGVARVTRRVLDTLPAPVIPPQARRVIRRAPVIPPEAPVIPRAPRDIQVTRNLEAPVIRRGAALATRPVPPDIPVTRRAAAPVILRDRVILAEPEAIPEDQRTRRA